MDARRFIRRHNDSGYIIMSAERTTNSKSENEKATKELIEKLRSSNYGFNFIKVYGGYVMSSDGQKTQEVSFVILPYRKNEPVELAEFVISCRVLACVFKQESILIKESRRDTPYLWMRDGGEKVFLPSNVVYNDESQEYYTDFRKGTSGKLGRDKRATRFSFV